MKGKIEFRYGGRCDDIHEFKIWQEKKGMMYITHYSDICYNGVEERGWKTAPYNMEEEINKFLLERFYPLTMERFEGVVDVETE